MPTVKPSDKTGREGEWWRKDHADHGPDAVNTEQSSEDNAEAGKNKFEEEQNPVRHPV